ncbi:glycosyltransferase [Burkholderia sp. NLJ2]|uniref:glycosyltransferase n=1 Tax=Burkholderia sp. NLJ2 TaxID=3090699 RepID=UPI003C6C8232
MNNTVAIIIPTRNRRALLARALQSVFCQTYAQIEVIVVNDGSTDDTRAFLDALAAREARLTVRHNERSMGAPAARNLAIGLSDAGFVTGLDDDDEFLPTRIESLVSAWHALDRRSGNVACLFTESVMFDGVTRAVTRDRKESVSYPDLFRHNFIGNQIFCPTQRVRAIGCYDTALPAWQDLDLFMRITKTYGSARRISDASYVCYADDRPDRISKNSASLRQAFDLICRKHAEVSGRLHHQLYMQIFSQFYGTRPTFDDWKRLVTWRADAETFMRMLRADIRCRVLRLGRPAGA